MHSQSGEVSKSLDTPKLVDTKTAAGILGTQPQTLVLWRCTKRYSLPYIKIGRLVMYDVADLVTFMEERKVRGKSRRSRPKQAVTAE